MSSPSAIRLKEVGARRASGGVESWETGSQGGEGGPAAAPRHAQDGHGSDPVLARSGSNTPGVGSQEVNILPCPSSSISCWWGAVCPGTAGMGASWPQQPFRELPSTDQRQGRQHLTAWPSTEGGGVRDGRLWVLRREGAGALGLCLIALCELGGPPSAFHQTFKRRCRRRRGWEASWASQSPALLPGYCALTCYIHWGSL